MRPINAQYFITFAVLGATLPYLPIYFSDRGLSATQIGEIMSVMGVAVFVSPAVLTLLADKHVPGRVLIGGIFALAGVALLVLLNVSHFWALLICHALFAMAFAPMLALQDGLHFGIQRKRAQQDLAVVPYHRVRVFGTYGWILPAIVMWAIIAAGASVSIALLVGVGLAAIGVLHAPRLPKLEIEKSDESIPTLDAVRKLMEPHALVFCVSMFLVQLCVVALYTFYPLYLERTIGIPPQWIGLIISIGVVIEIFFMLGFGKCLKVIGLKWLVVIGLLATALRFALLAAYVNPYVAIGTQVLHGFLVMMVHVAPPVFLDRLAEDRYRNSIQGVYGMAVFGSGRIIGNIAGGWIAEISITAVFSYSVALCLGSTGLFMFAFSEKRARGRAS